MLSYKGRILFFFLGVYRRSRFNEELGQSPAAESPAVNAPSDMRVDMSPSPEGPGKFDLRLPMEGFVHLCGKQLLSLLFFLQLLLQNRLCICFQCRSRFFSRCLSSGPTFPLWKLMVFMKGSFCVFLSMVRKNDFF